MSQWQYLGSYLNRPVSATSVTRLNELEQLGENLKKCLMLVILGQQFKNDSVGRDALRAIIAARPLALVVFGHESRIAFDFVIAELSLKPSNPHIITNVLTEGELGDGVETFLISTWPAEGRFDEWKSYNILFLGDVTSQYLDESYKEIKMLLDK
jgi:hypothetical protein